MDVARLRASYETVRPYGGELARLFYARLFLHYPHLRPMFPGSMQDLRRHLIDALDCIVAAADRPEELTVFLSHLGVTHRRFGVQDGAGHYEAVGAALLSTLGYFSGREGWTAEKAADWAEAYQLISGIMLTAAAEDAKDNPPWYEAAITDVRRRAWNVTVLTLRPDPVLPYQPGQSVPLEHNRMWRWYSPAHPPRDDGTIDIHVRTVPGGAVSMALTAIKQPGGTVILGAPAGSLTLRPLSRPVLLAGWSTGIAPLEALAGQILAMPGGPPVILYYAARGEDGLYERDTLVKMAAEHPRLSVFPVTVPAAGSAFGEILAQQADWRGHDVYAAGPADIIAGVREYLTDAGVPHDQVHCEDFGWKETEPG